MLPLSATKLFQMQVTKRADLEKSLLTIQMDQSRVKPEAVEDQISTISRRFNFAPVKAVIGSLEDRKIILTHNDSIKLPKMIPFVLTPEGKDPPTALVNMTGWCRKTKTTNRLDIDEMTLFALLQGAEIGRVSYKKWSAISTSVKINKLGATIFAKMICAVLDKMKAISINPIRHDKAWYASYKFFLLNFMERNPGGIVDELSAKSTPNGTSLNTLKNVDENSDDLSDGITGLFRVITRIEGLESVTLRSFMDEFMQRYGDSAALMLEYWPFFCFAVFSAEIGAAKVNRTHMILQVASNEITELYQEVTAIVRR